MSILRRVLSCCLVLVCILCFFLSSLSLPVSANSSPKTYTFGGLPNTVVVEDNLAKYTVDVPIPIRALHVFDENLTCYRVKEGEFFTFYPDHTYKVTLLSKRFLLSDFPVDNIQSTFLLSPSGAASNADFSDFSCNVNFAIQFRDSSGDYIKGFTYPAHFSSGRYTVSMIPEDIPANAVSFDFCIVLTNFFVHTSSDSSDYCFWLDEFSVTSIVERSGVFSRTVSLSSELMGTLIDQFIFTDIYYNCGPVFLKVDHSGFNVSCDDQTYRWNFDGGGVFYGVYGWDDGSPLYLEPGDSYVYYGTHLKLACEIEYSFWDKIEVGFDNFFEAVGTFFSSNPFEGILNAIMNFRNEVAGFFSGLVDSIRGFFSSIPDMIAPVIAPIQNWISSIGDNISNLGSSLVESLGIPSWISDLSGFISNNFITNAFRNLWDWLSSVLDFFSIPVTYDSANLTFWDYLLGRTGEDGSFWDYQDDAGFLAGISNFYSSVVDVWNAFPVPLRYLVMFGFCLPVSVGIIKSFLR